MANEYKSTTEAAEYLGVSRRTLERALKDGRIKSVTNPITGRRQFRVSELDNMWKAPGRRAAPTGAAARGGAT